MWNDLFFNPIFEDIKKDFFEIRQFVGQALGKNMNYKLLLPIEEYREITKQYQKDSLSYSSSLVDAIGTLSRDCERICNIAYSDEVAKQKNGSDVNGAINQAIRLLRANEQQSDYSYIILVSDGCDNVGKELAFFPQSAQLLLVNSNVAKHQYDDIVEREFVTLSQASNYIFNF